MAVTTCGMCNQMKSYGSGCGCRTTKKCKTPVASIMVNGQVSNQETVEFLGGCIDSQVVQDGCGHKLQLSFPCVSYNKDTQILTVEQGGELCEIDLSTLGDMDVYVNQGMFDGSNLLLTDTNSNTITVDISSLASSYTQNADGSITLTSGNGVDEVTIPAPFVHTPSSYTKNADGTITLDNGAGQTIDIPAQAISAYSFNSDGDLILDNGVDTPTVVPLGCCNTTVSVDANNNLVIEQDGGDDVVFDLTPVLNAQNITYDNSSVDNPATNVQSALDWLAGQVCTDGFTINAGTTIAATDNSLGEEVVECGDVVHFWSPDGTINFTVTPGSVVVGADVDISDILSTDVGNSAVLGTDGNIFVPITIDTTIYDRDGTLTGNRTMAMAGNEMHFNSGVADQSNIFLDQLDGNSPKQDCSTATPLGYDNTTGELVPFDIVNEMDMPLYIKGINLDMTGTPTLVAGDYDVFQLFPGQDNFTVPVGCLNPGEKWIVDVDCQYFATNVTGGVGYEFQDSSNRWEEIILANQIRVNGSPTRMNGGDSQDTTILSPHGLLTSNNVATYRDRFNVNEGVNTIEVRPSVNLKQTGILTGNPNIRITTVMSYTIKKIKS